MQGDDLAGNYESLWKAQGEETMRMSMDEICIKARALEQKSVREYWLVLGVLGLSIATAVMYVIQFSDPLIRVGFASGIATFLYIAFRWTRNGPPQRVRSMSKSDACIDFLRGELERKRQNLLEIRCTLFLLFPGMLASWWGGGPVAIAKNLGIDASRYIRFQESPGPLIGFVLLLVACWVAFGKEARAVAREIEKLARE